MRREAAGAGDEGDLGLEERRERKKNERVFVEKKLSTPKKKTKEKREKSRKPTPTRSAEAARKAGANATGSESACVMT